MLLCFKVGLSGDRTTKQLRMKQLTIDRKNGASGNADNKSEEMRESAHPGDFAGARGAGSSSPGQAAGPASEAVHASSGKNEPLPSQEIKADEGCESEEIPAKRSKIARNQIIIFANFVFTLLAIVILGAGLALYIAKGMFEGEGPSQEAHTILINPGTGIRTIGTMLESEKLITNAQIFIYGVNWERKAKELKAGEYEIPAHASMRQIMDILVLGRSIEHSFTVPEGLTVAQAFERLGENDILTGALPWQLPPEGWLMTDTVKFVRGTSRAEIVKRLQNGQSRLVKEIWAARDPHIPLKNMNELVTLASIVEKETGIAAERPRVAAVFYNRLKKNMRLQSDPTVIYGIFGSEGKPANRPIYRSDLERETPFNTYKINGLPPSPIANPGRDSLKAVANPPHTDDLYFVADGKGGHIFSKTLNEHNANVVKWRQFRKVRDSSVDEKKNAGD